LELANYYNQLQSKEILLSYKGAFTHELLDCLLYLTENKLDLLGGKKSMRKKVYTIVVELLQNIYHHFDPVYFKSELEDLEAVTFLIGKQDEEYNILAGNYIENSRIGFLKSVIDELNLLSDEELKTRYRHALDTGTFTDKGGAGLGMLFIARKSIGKIEYLVKDADYNHSFFSLKIKVGA
jgi:hypothetical protein